MWNLKKVELTEVESRVLSTRSWEELGEGRNGEKTGETALSHS